ncbi:MAG: glycosyltransferase family 2 protein [Deltaproteobacteria bacterium]|nr:glycosyltransferase family 2 protein [Deltaproteobacteria bacterium]
MSLPRVTACVVTYQSATSLSLCLNAFFAQKGVEPRAIVVDNASTDGSADIAEKFDAATVARLAENSGFAAGMNRAIAQADTDLILLLNPDVVLSESAAATLAAALSGAPSDVAAVQPKLVSPHSDPPRLDSTGIELRLFRLDPRDRGHGEIDTGRYDAARGVFGVTGACSLWRRSVLAGLAIGGEVFDEGFFAYYEDVDLCWRAGRFGYRFLYCPEAQATHPRRNPPPTARTSTRWRSPTAISLFLKMRPGSKSRRSSPSTCPSKSRDGLSER